MQLFFRASFVILFLYGLANADTVPENQAPDVIALGEVFANAVIDTSTSVRSAAIRKVYSAETLNEHPESKLLDLFDRLRNEYGNIEYHHSEISYFVLHIYARSPVQHKWLDIQARLEKQPPYKIRQVVFVAQVAEPVYLPNGPINSPEVLDWLNSYVDKLVREEDLSGSVLVAVGDTPILERHFGYADPAEMRKVTADTRFNLGSGNKMFTALCIMKLAIEGKLSLDDPISTYFADFPYPEFAKKATIRHLLSHTSGLGDYWTDDYEKHWDRISTLQQILPFVYVDSVYFEPGESFQYSNSGYILLGLIIEKVTDTDYFEFVQKTIYDSLGMSRSGSYTWDNSDIDRALPMVRDGDGWKVAPHGLRGSSAGGGLSNCRDMLRFVRGLVSGKLVNATTLQQMISPQSTTANPNFNYGYGLILWRSETDVFSFGHGGQAYGINFEIRYYPKSEITTVVLCNQDNGAFDSLRGTIEKLITGDR